MRRALLALSMATTLASCGERWGGEPFAGSGEAPSWQLNGRVLVLPLPGEALAPDAAAADVASVERVLDSFRWEALPYLGPEPTLRSEVILDPGLASEDTGLPTPGLCDHTSQTVVLNRDLWRSYGEDEREVVLFHELGHCELGRRHTHGRRPEGGPESLMNSNAVADTDAVVRDRAFYVHELFATKQPPPRFRLGR